MIEKIFFEYFQFKKIFHKKNFFFLTKADLYTKMCRMKFQETLRINNGISDLSIKSYSRKTTINMDELISLYIFLVKSLQIDNVQHMKM